MFHAAGPLTQAASHGWCILDGRSQNGGNPRNHLAVKLETRRQRKDARGEPLRNRQGRHRTPRAVSIHAMTAGIEIASRQHILGRQNGDQIVARKSGRPLVDFDDHVLKVARFLRIERNEIEPVDAGQSPAISLVIRPVGGDDRSHLVEGRQPDGGGQLAHLAVCADGRHTVITDESEVAQ